MKSIHFFKQRNPQEGLVKISCSSLAFQEGRGLLQSGNNEFSGAGRSNAASKLRCYLTERICNIFENKFKIKLKVVSNKLHNQYFYFYTFQYLP